jgi:ABC-type arginine/histidine transport system permease subunit
MELQRTITLVSDITISATFRVGTSVENMELITSLQVYPNPVVDVLYIQTNEVIQEITVFDMNGRAVKTFRGDYRTLDLQSLAPGHYIVRFHTATAIVPIRIIKQ